MWRISRTGLQACLCYDGSVGGGAVVPIEISPRVSASAGVKRLSRQQPPFHHCGRSRQIWRIGVVLILPTGGIPKHASTSPFGITWILVSAELRPNQTDQDSLPPYDVLDALLKGYVEEGLSRRDLVAQGFPEATVSDVIRKVDLNEYKRKQAAPGLKITPLAFGVGLRLL